MYFRIFNQLTLPSTQHHLQLLKILININIIIFIIRVFLQVTVLNHQLLHLRLQQVLLNIEFFDLSVHLFEDFFRFFHFLLEAFNVFGFVFVVELGVLEVSVYLGDSEVLFCGFVAEGAHFGVGEGE